MITIAPSPRGEEWEVPRWTQDVLPKLPPCLRAYVEKKLVSFQREGDEYVITMAPVAFSGPLRHDASWRQVLDRLCLDWAGTGGIAGFYASEGQRLLKETWDIRRTILNRDRQTQGDIE